MTTYGFLGLGIMGGAMAANLVKAGFDVTGVVFMVTTIAFSVMGFNLLGDGLRDILDPKMVRIR